MEEEPTRGERAAEPWQSAAENEAGSGWVTTEVAAAALGVSPRTVRDYIQSGEIEAKAEGEGVTKRWLVSIDSVQAVCSRRRASGEMPRSRRSGKERGDNAAEDAAAELLATVQELQYRLGRAEARAELTERAESTIREERDRVLEDLRRERERADTLAGAQEEAQRLREELEAERSKGFWRRLFGG
jgi:small-conductance mechanosensitive channel